MNVPEDLKYVSTHEWVRLAGDVATVGITDHAQHELTDIVFVDLPKIGTKLTAGGQAANIDSIKSANDIYAPVTGEVVGINAKVQEDPALVNSDPYGDGWLFQVKVTDPGTLDKLMTPGQYRETIG